MLLLAPIILVSVGLSVAATVAQTRPIFVLDSIKPKFNRINPLEGFKRLFSVKSLFEAIKGIIKIAILIAILYSFISDSLITIVRQSSMDIGSSNTVLLKLVVTLAFFKKNLFGFLSELPFLITFFSGGNTKDKSKCQRRS